MLSSVGILRKSEANPLECRTEKLLTHQHAHTGMHKHTHTHTPNASGLSRRVLVVGVSFPPTEKEAELVGDRTLLRLGREEEYLYPNLSY